MVYYIQKAPVFPAQDELSFGKCRSIRLYENVIYAPSRNGGILAKVEFVIRTDRQHCLRNGEQVSLSALEYRLFMFFLNHRGQIVSRELLLDEIWDVGGDFVNDNTLTVYIKRLREKIGDDPAGQSVIKTVRGLGYRVD